MSMGEHLNLAGGTLNLDGGRISPPRHNLSIACGVTHKVVHLVFDF